MTRYKVWLDGIGLHDVDPSIHITDVQEHAPALLSETASRAVGEGRHILRHARQSLTVTVRFAIREIRPVRRSAILQKVLSWARQGGCLTLSQRPGQRLQVAPGEINSFSTLRWTEELSLSFSTRCLPYWEEELPAQLTAPAEAIRLPGNGPAAAADLYWRSPFAGTATLSVTTPLGSVTLRDMSVAEGSELQLSHACGVLTASLDGADALPFRTPESSDDLLLSSGQTSPVTVQVNGRAASGFILSARGLWL